MSSSQASAAAVPRVGIRRDQVIILGRYVSVFRPVMDSILDTIFWGDGYKSIAHIVMMLYLSYHNLCGIRFMFLFTMFHFFMKAGKRGECSDDEAIFQFKMAVQDLTIVMRRYNPTLSHIWPLLLVVALFGSFVEVVLQQSIVAWVDHSIGPLSVMVIMICYGLVDPRHTRTYMTPAAGTIGDHKRAASQHVANSAAKPARGSQANADTPRSNAGSDVAPNTERTLVATVPPTISPLTLVPKADPFSPLETQSTRSSDAVHRYSAEETPTAPWDELMPPCSTLPTFVHKNLMLYTSAPAWKDWKIATDIVARDHPISWTIVKAGLNIVTLRDISFDEAVSFINDDPDFRTPVEDLSVFQFDKLLGEFRRLAIIDEYTRVIHMIYKQLIFGIAPRDAPMYQFAKELTREEIDYYGLCREHANNTKVTNGQGRVFVLSSAPADGVAPVKGHVRIVVHRQAIIIREIPGTNTIEVMTLMCGEPGGNVPSRIVEMTRGEQVKVVVAMRKALGAFVAKMRKTK
jgi:hypothetical protein